MEKFLFEDVEGFVDKFLEEYENHENDKDFDGVSIVAHYEHIRDILNYLVKNTCFEVYDVELKTYESDFYRDEYTLVVDEDKKIWCQKVKFDKDYLHLEEKVIFVHSDVNSQFVIKNEGENMIEFDFATEEETECKCDECCDCGGCEGKCKMCNKQCSENAVCPSDCDFTACEDCPHKPEVTATVGNNGYEIKIKCNLDAEDALRVIENMEKRMERVNDIFKEMNEFRKIFRW